MFCKIAKTCYNIRMAKKRNFDNKTLSNDFLGAPTAPRLAGEIFTATILLILVVSLVFSLFVVGNPGFENSEAYVYCSFLVPQLCFALALAFTWFRARPSLRVVATKQKCHPKYFVVAILLQIGLFGLAEVNTLFLRWLGAFGYADEGIQIPSMEGFGFVAVLFVIAVLPAIFEESVFRGVMLNGLRSFGTLGAVLICGALFALYHQNPAQTIYQFCCGVAFALVAIRSSSILPTALSHCLNNAVVLVLTKFGVTEIVGVAQIAVYGVSFVCLVGSLVWLIVFDKKAEPTKTDASTCDKKDFFSRAFIGALICAVVWIAVLFEGITGA